jgi:peroxiredoxin Q/BCP
VRDIIYYIMVELRKRKAPTEAAAPAKKAAAPKGAKKSKPSPKPDEVIEEAPAGAAVDGDASKETPADEAAADASATNGDADAPKESKTEEKPKAAAKAAVPVVKEGDSIDLEGFGGEVTTHDGVKTTLKELVEKSEAGVILFTYPKANTPGCKYPFP